MQERQYTNDLFGSTVRGDSGRLSDVDIGVMLDEKLSKKDRFDLELKLMGEIAILIRKNKIDLIVLNESPLLLAYNIIKSGIILKSDETQRVKFETMILSMYMDQKYYIKKAYGRNSEEDCRGWFFMNDEISSKIESLDLHFGSEI